MSKGSTKETKAELAKPLTTLPWLKSIGAELTLNGNDEKEYGRLSMKPKMVVYGNQMEIDLKNSVSIGTVIL